MQYTIDVSELKAFLLMTIDKQKLLRLLKKLRTISVAYREGFRRRYTGLGAQIMCPNYLLMVEIKFKP